MNKIMGGGLLTLLLATASIADETRWYAGAELGTASNTFTIEDFDGSEDWSNNYSDFKFVVGKGTGNNWFTQAYLSSITYKKDVFKDKKQIEFGLEAIKKFDITDQLSPFVKIGWGLGSMDLPKDEYTDDTISSFAVAIGVGVDYKLLDQLSIIGGIDFGYRKWQDVELTYCYSSSNCWTETLEVSATYQKMYVGANYRF